MNKAEKNKNLSWLKLIFGFLIFFFAFLIFADRNNFLITLGGANWFFVAPAFLLVLFSYFLAACAYTLLNEIFGLEAERKRLFTIGLITIVFNNLITLGGTVGYSLRVLLLKNQKNKSHTIVVSSLFFSYLNFLIIMVFSSVSLAYILLNNIIYGNIAIVFQIAFFIFILLSAFLTFIMFSVKFRRFFFSKLSGLLKSIFKLENGEWLEEYNQALDLGLKTIRKMPGTFASIMLLIAADWISCIFIFWFCFKAFNVTLAPISIFSGFFLSVVAGLISMIPGGLGIQDLSEAGIYNILGAPFFSALAVSMLFRIIYYFIPFSLVLVAYWRLISGKKVNN